MWEVMEFERRNGNGSGNGLIYNNRGDREERECGGGGNSPTMATLKVFPVSSSSPPSSLSSSPARYVEHHVSKLDTLAGIAIRYGVEVADIKKMNGLVTDLQMFARKTLHIPLPGRHPPSPCLSNGHTSSRQTSSEQTPRHVLPDLFESFQSLRVERKVSPAMSSLQGYYGLNDARDSSEGCEMAVYNEESSSYHETEGFTTPLISINHPLNHHKRSRSLANGFKTEECDPTDDVKTNINKWIDKLSWQHQNSEADYPRTPEKLLKEENGSGSWFSAITGKSLALRTKATSRTNLASEAEAGTVHGFLTSPGDIVAESLRKSLSTSSLQDQDNSSSTSIWSALKPDLPAALAKPIFDGLPKPISGRRAKASLD